MKFLDKILLQVGLKIMTRFFSTISMYHKNDQVKVIHFAVSTEDLKQSVVEQYFHILNEDNNDKRTTG